MTPTIGVVVPTRDPDPELLQATLASLSDQERPPDQMVVVDDGSRHPVVVDGPVRVVRQAPSGIAAARNAGLKLLHTDLAHVLDHDDLVLRAFYATVLPVASAADVVFTECELIDRGGRPVGARLTDEPVDTAHMLRTLYRRNPIASSAAVFRVDLWRGLRYRDLRYVQDWDFWLRAARSGARFAYVDQVHAQHRLHAGQTSAALPSARLQETLRMLSRQRPSRHQPRAVARTWGELRANLRAGR